MSPSSVSLIAFLSLVSSLSANAEGVLSHKLNKDKVASEKGSDSHKTTVRLTNVNSRANHWYILSIGKISKTLHLQTARPGIKVELYKDGLILSRGSKGVVCHIFGSAREAREEVAYPPADLSKDRKNISLDGPVTTLPDNWSKPTAGFQSVCGGQLFIRTPARVNDGSIEETGAQALRTALPFFGIGNAMVTKYKETTADKGYIPLEKEEKKSFVDNFLGLFGQKKPEPAKAPAPKGEAPVVKRDPPKPVGPMAALTLDQALPSKPGVLGIKVNPSNVTPGSWSAVQIQGPEAYPGIYATYFGTRWVKREIMSSYGDRVSRLTGQENNATVFLVAMDLDRYDMGYALGANDPALAPSPDGITSIAPLVRLGMPSPYEQVRARAIFVGGFKREHGRALGGAYGFIQSGVEFSRLNPGLATVYVKTDGSVGMKTWTQKDNAWKKDILHARQNGVPIIESYDPKKGFSTPGQYVDEHAGNWSGDIHGSSRTARSGICLQKFKRQNSNGEMETKRYLIFGQFTDHTSSGMARIFQSLRCSYAMLLDMNDEGMTFFALSHYNQKTKKWFRQYLNPAMRSGERGNDPSQGQLRFLTRNDRRDIFFLTKKEK